jgi:hypothetical protein
MVSGATKELPMVHEDTRQNGCPCAGKKQNVYISFDETP